ncbi:TadE/TadG family type IV pilus assembly protein [Hephaestia sp. GCM10023244]|uniref:TadE/TadG family type IV pilus assembly protein n=1 Tax=unclassified Hephaestia TaxID=2631281 RepID=UPI002076DFCC|nr:TadE/TadG family type IV pilus assembly protein [Hephaestia sp. MAHUQ-44]MCM8729478.1 pilus assembly protein [Hephaestia sp. MAHUQ-44]
MQHPARFLAADRRGVAIVEMALVLPLLITLLLGLVCYGQYFLIAHSVQQIANDAARAAIAGLSPDERSRLAIDAAGAAAAANPEIDAGAMQVAVSQQGAMIAVRITVDADARLIRFPLVPMPSPQIARNAAVLVPGAGA